MEILHLDRVDGVWRHDHDVEFDKLAASRIGDLEVWDNHVGLRKFVAQTLDDSPLAVVDRRLPHLPEELAEPLLDLLDRLLLIAVGLLAELKSLGAWRSSRQEGRGRPAHESP